MNFPRRRLAVLLVCVGLALPAAAATRAPAAPLPVAPQPTATAPATTAAAPGTPPAIAPATPVPGAPVDPLAQPVLPPAPPAPRVALETSLGRIVLELYPRQAPATVANFLAYARRGHYNGTVFHRAIPGVLLQGGGFTVDLQPKPERVPVRSESINGLRNTRGTLAAARRPGDPDSAGAQFFINLGDNPAFDRHGDTPATAGWCVFGRVIDGLDVADRLAALPTGPRAPFAADVPIAPAVIERTDLLPPAPAVAPVPTPIPTTPPAP